MKFRELFISFALIGIFILCMVNFGFQMAQDNNANESILSHSGLNATFNALISDDVSGNETSLKIFRNETQKQREVFEKDTTVGTGFFIISSVIGAGRIFGSMIIGIFNLIISPLESIIGIDKTVIGVFASILIVSIVLLAWRVYKAGS